MSISTQISYYLRVAIEINKKVGGTRAYQAESNNRDKFVVIRDIVNKNLHYIRTKLEEREKRKGADVNVINIDIRQKIQDIYDQLVRMRESVEHEKTKEEVKDLKYKMIEKLSEQTRELQDLMDNVNSTASDRNLLFGKNNNETYTDMRVQLLETGKQSNRIQSNKNNNSSSKNNTPTEIEITAMKKWDARQVQEDIMIDSLIEKTKKWKEGVIQTGQLIDESDKKIMQLTQDVDKVNDDLFKSNKQLKGVVEKFRKPHKFCLDVILALILIGLIVALIKVANS